MTTRAEVWVHDTERRVICQEEQGGVPAFAIQRPDGSADGYYVGHYEVPSMGWGEAGRMAEMIAKGAGYRVEYDAPSLDCLEG